MTDRKQTYRTLDKKYVNKVTCWDRTHDLMLHLFIFSHTQLLKIKNIFQTLQWFCGKSGTFQAVVLWSLKQLCVLECVTKNAWLWELKICEEWESQLPLLCSQCDIQALPLSLMALLDLLEGRPRAGSWIQPYSLSRRPWTSDLIQQCLGSLSL